MAHSWFSFIKPVKLWSWLNERLTGENLERAGRSPPPTPQDGTVPSRRPGSPSGALNKSCNLVLILISGGPTKVAPSKAAPHAWEARGATTRDGEHHGWLHITVETAAVIISWMRRHEEVHVRRCAVDGVDRLPQESVAKKWRIYNRHIFRRITGRLKPEWGNIIGWQQ